MLESDSFVFQLAIWIIGPVLVPIVVLAASIYLRYASGRRLPLMPGGFALTGLIAFVAFYFSLPERRSWGYRNSDYDEFLLMICVFCWAGVVLSALATCFLVLLERGFAPLHDTDADD